MKQLAKVFVVLLAVSLLTPAVPQAAEAEGPSKVRILHNGKIIEVGEIAATMHVLLHGDTRLSGLPQCPPNCPF